MTRDSHARLGDVDQEAKLKHGFLAVVVLGVFVACVYGIPWMLAVFYTHEVEIGSVGIEPGIGLVARDPRGGVLHVKAAAEEHVWADCYWEAGSTDAYVLLARGREGQYWPEAIYAWSVDSGDAEELLNRGEVESHFGKGASIGGIQSVSKSGAVLRLKIGYLEVVTESGFEEYGWETFRYHAKTKRFEAE